MTAYTDRALVELAQQGDVAAIAELFSRYWRAARAAAFGVTGEFSTAEDAAAEAFTDALIGLKSLRDLDRFGAWLRTIVVRKARLCRDGRLTALDGAVEARADPRERPDDTLERRELAAVIHDAVRELPEPLREAIALFYFEGYDSDAAARFLDVPSGTLRRRLHDGRTQLRSTVERLLQRSKRMDDDRERQIERIAQLMDDNELYRALKEALALRPLPTEMFDLLARRHGGTNAGAFIRTTAERLLRPSEQALDPTHHVGSAAIAIRNALPDFREWHLDPGESAARFLTSSGAHRVLPPGFAEGRPGAFVRATRAWLILTGDGVRSIYEHIDQSPDAEVFRASQGRLSDVLDLTWMAAGRLELRAVQQLLERVAASVVPGQQLRFARYDEPRYRSALQLHVSDVAARAGCGGVLVEWPGRPGGVDAAHVRLFLEPWATVRSGEIVDFPHEA